MFGVARYVLAKFEVIMAGEISYQVSKVKIFVPSPYCSRMHDRVHLGLIRTARGSAIWGLTIIVIGVLVFTQSLGVKFSQIVMIKTGGFLPDLWKGLELWE